MPAIKLIILDDKHATWECKFYKMGTGYSGHACIFRDFKVILNEYTSRRKVLNVGERCLSVDF